MTFEKHEKVLAATIFLIGLVVGMATCDFNFVNRTTDYYASGEFHEDLHKYANDIKYRDDLVAQAKLENLKVDMCAESYAAGMADMKAIMNAHECMILKFPDSNGMHAFRYNVEIGQVAEGWGTSVPNGETVEVCQGVDNLGRCINKTFSVNVRSCFE